MAPIYNREKHSVEDAKAAIEKMKGMFLGYIMFIDDAKGMGSQKTLQASNQHDR